MRKAKFWVMQIVMLAIISLVFGAPVFADPSDQGKASRSGSQSDNASDQGKDKASDKSVHGDGGSGSSSGSGSDTGDGGDGGDGGDACVPDLWTSCP